MNKTVRLLYQAYLKGNLKGLAVENYNDPTVNNYVLVIKGLWRTDAVLSYYLKEAV